MVRTTAPGTARTREQRWHERWDRTEGPGPYERWMLGAPWRMVVMVVTVLGASAGWSYVRFVDAPFPASRLMAVASWAVSVALVPVAWVAFRRRATAYADWARSRGVGQVEAPGRPGSGTWLLAAAAGLAAALATVAYATRPVPAPPPDGEAIGRAVAGSGNTYRLLDADTASTGPRELSLEESQLTTWFVATLDADGACHALRFVHGELDEQAPLPEPCTGRHAAQVHG